MRRELTPARDAPARDASARDACDGERPSLAAECVEFLREQIAQADGAGLPGNLAGFDGPPLSDVGEYMRMITRRQKCSPSCAVVALVYLERLKGKIPDASVNSRNARLLLLTAMMVAGKWLEDENFSNRDWAAIAGISVYDLNRLELFLLATLHWGVFVSQDEFLSVSPSFWEATR